MCPTDSSLATMMEARSVALVGASARQGSFGEQLIETLMQGGFDGRVFPVNPNYEQVSGLRCYPSLEDVPEPIELAVLGVPNAHLEAQLRMAAELRIPSAAIFASCYEDPEPGRQALTERLAAMATEAGMAICGGNGMGLVNLDRGLRICGYAMPADLPPGGITFISHSGSAFSAMLHNDHGLRFNLVVSAGQELATTTADYLTYALDQPTTRAAALFIETVRDPERFRAALGRAADRDIPVVVLKVGREARASELVAAHSGALAGEDGAYEALFDFHGTIRVETLDEMADTLELVASPRRAPAGGLAAIHDSGGERALLIDAAATAGVRLAEIGADTTAKLEAVLDPGLPPVNPLDAWGTGNKSEEIFIACMHALLEDPDTAALAFCVDMTTERVPEAGYSLVASEVFARTDKPVAVLANMASAVDRRDAAFVRGIGMPVLEGTGTGLMALRHLFEYRDHRARPPAAPGAPVQEEIRDRWRGRLSQGTAIGEAEGLRLLRDYGIPAVEATEVSSAEEAVAAAQRIGWPVALKTASAGIAHKSDTGGVRLGLVSPTTLGAAYEEMAARLGPLAVVAPMAPAGVELALGVVRDPQFGPLLMIAAGGVLVEVLRDRRFALPPLDEPRAHDMIDRLAARPLLDGARGGPVAEVGAVAAAAARLSVLAQDLGQHLEALDVNPLIAGPTGCLAVDALVIPRAAT